MDGRRRKRKKSGFEFFVLDARWLHLFQRIATPHTMTKKIRGTSGALRRERERERSM
jgi:hypothetical protein